MKPGLGAIVEYIGPTVEANGYVVLANGAKGKVTRIDMNCFRVEFPNGVKRDVREATYLFREIEMAADEPTKKGKGTK